jgi:hypothetical protein
VPRKSFQFVNLLQERFLEFGSSLAWSPKQVASWRENPVRKEKGLERKAQVLFWKTGAELEAGVDGREDLADQRAHDGDGGDDDDGDEYQDQSVLNHALSFFLE